MQPQPRIVFLLDVDNTLLDNDAAKVALDAGLESLIGKRETARFWSVYEEVRHDLGMVSVPLTLKRFHHRAGALAGAVVRDMEQGDKELLFALADLVMGFPFERFVFPGALETIAHLRRLGRTTILSDGDPTYQASKIVRSGLAAAVGGYALVIPHKEDYLEEVRAAFPADHYVLVDDKPLTITRVRERLADPLTTVLIKQGKYAAQAGPGPWAGADLTIEVIGDLQGLSAEQFIEAGGRAPATAG